MDYQTYKTRADAQRAVDAMQGWPDAAPQHLYLPDALHADSEGNAWVIEATSGQYMREDGYVR
jgi:hypothetical protein